MELRHLRYFVAVADELSFTKAAARLHLAQPSLTRQVRNLEDEIGVRLLERTKNRVELTDPGRLFLADAKKVLAMCAESVAAVQRMDRGESAELNIGYVANVHYGLLPATLGAFRKLCPLATLNLFDLTSAEQYVALESGKIDLGFVGLRPAALAGRDFLSERVADDTILVALPKKHPLGQQRKISLDDLASQFFIVMADKTQPGARAWLERTCAKSGFSARILQEAETEMTAIAFVADGLGVALLPNQVASLPHEGVVFAAFSPPLLRESTITWRASNQSKALRDYIQIVLDISKEPLK